MGLLRKVLISAPGVPRARQVAEFAVTSSVRSRLDHLEDIAQRFSGVADMVRRLDDQQPAVLNAITSTNGVARLLRRELDELRSAVTTRDETSNELARPLRREVDELRSAVTTLDETSNEVARLSAKLSDLELVTGVDAAGVRSDLAPHLDTIAWLLTRVETVRAEMLHELRYGKSNDAALIDAEIINPAALKPADGDIRLNLGCGHIPLDGFANVDLRPIPGVDVVAAADDLPVGPASVAEIFSAHMLEHFANEEMRRKLLPYWFTLLKPGGVFRAVVPDIESMVASYARGEIEFEQFRLVAYGGQEYEGDFHFNGFTPTSIGALLEAAGFEQVEVIAQGRENGDCLELEVRAIKPDT